MMIMNRLAFLAVSFTCVASSPSVRAGSRACVIIVTHELCEKLCCGKTGQGGVCADSCVDVPCFEDKECGNGCCSKGRCRDDKICDDKTVDAIIIVVVMIVMAIITAAVTWFLVRRCRRRRRREHPVGAVNTVVLPPRSTLPGSRQEDAMPLISEEQQEHDEHEGQSETGYTYLCGPPPAYTV